MTNPWRLSPREAEAMTMMAELGSQKAVAHKMGVAQNTVQELVYRAKKKIGVSISMRAIIQWDRWERTQCD